MSTGRAMLKNTTYKVQIADERATGEPFDLSYIQDQLYDASHHPHDKTLTLLFRAGTRHDMVQFIDWIEEVVLEEIRLEMPGYIPFDVVAQFAVCLEAVQKTVGDVVVWEVTFRCAHMENEPVELPTSAAVAAAPTGGATVTCFTTWKRERGKAS